MINNPPSWKWEVTSNGEMIANGFEHGRRKPIQGYNARCFLARRRSGADP